MTKHFLSLVVVLIATSASAQERPPDGESNPSSPKVSPVRIELGPNLAMASGDVCRQDSIDTVGCQQTFYAGVHAGAAYRPMRNLSLGARFAWGSGHSETAPDPSGRTLDKLSLHSQIVRTSIEVRGHLGSSGVDPFVAFELGLAWARDTASSSSGASDLVTHRSPLFGAGVGLDVPLTSWLSFAPEIRWTYLHFDREGRTLLGTNAPIHQETGALWIGASGAFRF